MYEIKKTDERIKAADIQMEQWEDSEEADTEFCQCDSTVSYKEAIDGGKLNVNVAFIG